MEYLWQDNKSKFKNDKPTSELIKQLFAEVNAYLRGAINEAKEKRREIRSPH